jgi:hypothetical protein
MSRAQVIVTFVVADLWQFVVGAGSSLQLGAPGVGDRASWVPNVLVGETYTLLPLGFVLCLLGTSGTRILAAGCGLASLIVGLAAAITLTPTGRVDISGIAVWFVLFAVPGLALIVSASRYRGRTPAESPPP